MVRRSDVEVVPLRKDKLSVNESASKFEMRDWSRYLRPMKSRMEDKLQEKWHEDGMFADEKRV